MSADRQRAAERPFADTEARYREVIARLPVIVCTLTPEGETLFVNDAVERITGYPAEELLGINWWLTLCPGRLGAEIERLRRTLEQGEISGFEMTIHGRNGEELLIEWSSASRHGADGELVDVVFIGVDVTERVRLREELKRMAVRDELTGLHNRRGFLTLADQLIKLAAREKTALLLVFVDMDGLKAINDRLGHAAGDQALRDMASVLRRTFREADVVGRLGGDEFVALVSEGSPFRADGILLRLQDRLASSNRSAGRDYLLSASVGVARYDPDAPCSIEELLNRADSLMYQRKQSRRRREGVVAGAAESGAS